MSLADKLSIFGFAVLALSVLLYFADEEGRWQALVSFVALAFLVAAIALRCSA